MSILASFWPSTYARGVLSGLFHILHAIVIVLAAKLCMSKAASLNFVDYLRRGDNVVHKLKVSLEEMYNGASRSVSLTVYKHSQQELKDDDDAIERLLICCQHRYERHCTV